MVNLRGKIIPVVSLRKKLGFDEIECGNATRIMVAEIENQILGFIVDSVSEVLRIQNADVEAAPSIGGGDTPYIEGVLNLPSRILILLDLTKLFNEDTRVAA
jgi:purine-binding chemotaxis protein CheW